MKKLTLLFTAIAIITLQNYAQTVTDIDGNVYNTVNIGTQLWLLENLKTTKLNDGTIIPNVTDTTSWSNLTTPGRCAYNNTTNADTINTYGLLYNWHTVNTGNLCPIGWHVPSDSEWISLTNSFGGDTSSDQLKEKDSIHWKPGPLKDFSPGNNVSGFTALPGGFRLDSGLQGTTHLIMRYGMYIGIGNYGNWWSSTSVNTNNAKEIGLSSMFTHVYNETWQKTMGLSVRCLNDNDTYVGAKITDELEIYPNPVHEKLFIKNTISTNPFVYIFNLQGEQILFKQNATNTINISNLEKGFYVIKILDFGKVKTAIFLKE